MKLDYRKLVQLAQVNYSEAWEIGEKLVQACRKRHKRHDRFQITTHGKKHVLFETINRFRDIYTDLGFMEVILPMTTTEKDIRNQMGPEAELFMTIMYSLACTDITFRATKESPIPYDILRKFESGQISGDLLLGEMSNQIGITKVEAIRLLEGVLRKHAPKPSTHLLKVDGLSWLPFLNNTMLLGESSANSPLRLFNIDSCFRREKIFDKFHLMSFHTCQSVVINGDTTISIGKDIVKRVLTNLGIAKVELRKDKKASMYYAPNTQFEIFVPSDKLQKWIEIGTVGMLSPVACAKYSIDELVLNIGICIERLVLALEGEIPY